MARDLLLPQIEDIDLTDLAVRGEALGYDGVWLGELWGTSAVVQLADIAAHTEAVTLGTAILNVYSRTPAVLAMTARTMDRLSDGRFVLGVGTSTEKAIEDLHGMAWNDPNPVRRAHETIELTRAFMGRSIGAAGDDAGDGGGRVAYDGEIFDVQDFPVIDADVPIYHAALGDANCRVVARLCDGWIPHNVPFPDLQDRFEYVVAHAEGVGRDDAHAIDVAPYVPSAVNDDPAEAKDTVRGHIAYYVGSGEGYQRAVGKRFSDDADVVAEHWRNGDRGEAVAAVTDEMVEALGVAGTPEQAREQFRDVEAIDCVSRPMVTVPANADAETAERTIEALAPQ